MSRDDHGERLAVIVPTLSTPSADNLAAVLARIESRLKVLKLSAHAASVQAERPDAIRNLRRAVSGGKRRGVTTDTLRALAPVLNTTAAWLLEGIDDKGIDVTTVEIAGHVGQDGKITTASSTAEVPILLRPNGLVAFDLIDNGLWPRYEAGDLILCRRAGARPKAILGCEAIVKTSSGESYLRRVTAGAVSETFDLESHCNPPIRGVTLLWASEVQVVLRMSFWRRSSS